MLTAEWAEIRPATPCDLMLDGQVFADVAGIKLRILPAALRCIDPRFAVS